MADLVKQMDQARLFSAPKAADDAGKNPPPHLGRLNYDVIRHRNGYVVRYQEPESRRVLGYLVED